MRPFTKKITEYGGPLAPVPAHGFNAGGPIGRATSSANKAKGSAAEQGGHLDSPLPDGIVKPGQYEDVAKEVIADAKRDAQAQGGSPSDSAIPESARQFIVKYEKLLRHLNLGAAADSILASVSERDETLAESSRRFPWQRPGLTQKQKSAAFAASLR